MLLLNTLDLRLIGYSLNSISCCDIVGAKLGAVGYSGFTPWYYDIDVGLPRPDYDRIIT